MRPHLVLLVGILAVAIAFVLWPFLGALPFNLAMRSALARAVAVFVIGPPAFLHTVLPMSHMASRVKVRFRLLLSVSGIAAIASLLLTIVDSLSYAFVVAVLSWLFTYFGWALWVRAVPTPRQVIIAEGERILANETDPREKQKFRWALDRFRKP